MPVDGLARGLISMGAHGLHPLFDMEWIRRAFDRVDSGLLQADELLLAHRALKRLARMQGIDEMRGYLRLLPEPTVDVLVFLYFRSVDQFIESRAPTVH